MISIIIPVYNVETYIEKCFDSIIRQTYYELEILVIDDGSIDSSDEICDRYAKKDERIRVFHTEHQGLSAARNIGIDNAIGAYLGFIDSDDWIEPDMYEVLLRRAEETGADIVECGYVMEYPNKTKEDKRCNQQMSSSNAIFALIDGKLSDTVWNKLWKRECYESIRFPNNRVFEEIATNYKAFEVSSVISTVSGSFYHYVQRTDSISRCHDVNNLIGYWHSHKERYDTLSYRMEEPYRKLLWYCAKAAIRIWAYYDALHPQDRNKLISIT